MYNAIPVQSFKCISMQKGPLLLILTCFYFPHGKLKRVISNGPFQLSNYFHSRVSASSQHLKTPFYKVVSWRHFLWFLKLVLTRLIFYILKQDSAMNACTDSENFSPQSVHPFSFQQFIWQNDFNISWAKFASKCTVKIRVCFQQELMFVRHWFIWDARPCSQWIDLNIYLKSQKIKVKTIDLPASFTYLQDTSSEGELYINICFNKIRDRSVQDNKYTLFPPPAVCHI